MNDFKIGKGRNELFQRGKGGMIDLKEGRGGGMNYYKKGKGGK